MPGNSIENLMLLCKSPRKMMSFEELMGETKSITTPKQTSFGVVILSLFHPLALSGDIIYVAFARSAWGYHF